MTKWSYVIERCETFKAPAMLAQRGEEGWELVNFQYVMQSPNEFGTFIFKRPQNVPLLD